MSLAPQRRLLASVVAALVGLVGCASEPLPVAPGIFAPLGDVMPRATDAQRAEFVRGREVALRSVPISGGLGPPFNATTCLACHEKPVAGGGAAHYRDFLIVAYRDPDGSYIPRGVNSSGVQAQFLTGMRGRVAEEAFVNLGANRSPIPFFGVGALAEVSDEEILRRADPADADGDGISGRPNFDRGFVGRFGRKAQSVDLEVFIRGPLFNHLGVTSQPLSNVARLNLPVPSGIEGAPASRRAGPSVAGAQAAQAGAPDEPTFDADPTPDPELSEPDLYALISFAMLLAAPQPDVPTPTTERGEQHFEDTGCASCHTPALVGPHGRVPAYTDLLLHDMGPELADGIEQGVATGAEFRTQPLWGVVAVSPYLHDGRATTLDEAIRLHGGEASSARDAYMALGVIGQEELLAFLASLGGRTQRTDGLLPPAAPLLAEGLLGAPRAGLADVALQQFTRGRAVFDRDMGRDVGLGPRFNGDSCRACHFQPAIGGAGPLDVDVIRHGTLAAGVFSAPSTGTVLHRHDTAGVRPAPEALLALADPADTDMNGISGRAHVLPDGRVGRFGWKAEVPSLAEFTRDALSVELGLTVPPQDGLTFGAATDADLFADPEIGSVDMEDLVAFVAGLAAPARQRRDAALEDVGEGLFTDVGCAGCHVPSLMTADGLEVRAYSDFLLHDVALPLAGGVAQGDATLREFRTAPLWGVSASAPYMHHGRSETLLDAIGAHSGEADAARLAFLALTPGEQNALLQFLASL